LIASVFLVFGQSAKAQVSVTGDTCFTTIVDTLHYYFNKYYFKTGITTYSDYPYYKSAAATVTGVTHVGSMFENADNTLTITGVEGYAAMPEVYAHPKIPIRMYLCNIGSNGLPILPAIDSITTEVNSTYRRNPKIIGGNFTTPHVVSGNYAVLFRNLSTLSGDTALLLRTKSFTHTYVATPLGWTDQYKYSDDNHAFIRFLGNFNFTKNFSLDGSPGHPSEFGYGTEYEFLVAPRVTYTVQASHQMSQNLLDWKNGDHTDTICARTAVFTFTNTSSYHYTNRFFN